MLFTMIGIIKGHLVTATRLKMPMLMLYIMLPNNFFNET